MSYRTRRILFSSPLFMIYEFFLLGYLLSFFGYVDSLYLLVVVICLEVVHVVPMFFESRKSTVVGRFLCTCYGVWEWFLLMITILMSIVYVTSLFVIVDKNMILIGLSIIALIGVYAFINARRIVVRKRVLSFPNLSRSYSILHLSDVHFGSLCHEWSMSKLRYKIVELEDECDLIIISGDLADGSCIVCEDDFMAFKDLSVPVVFTSGNHDYYPGIKSVHRACRSADMIVLENDSFQYDDLNIYGLSYSFGDIDMPSDDDLKNIIEGDMVNIVNYHVPHGWDVLCDVGFNLQLSGHTHGGQFYPVTWLSNLLFEGHGMGLFRKRVDENYKYLHVTCGVGCMDVPMRWGTKAEIVLLKLENE
ncbi:MAG: metallophosphatase [Methanosphaera sp. rholeuAM74]|nr:MAG: metallophosphatase [Methanosphaera sp. rholeuAM74]